MDNDYITALSYDEKLVFIKMFCKLIKADGVAVRHLCGAENNIRTTSRRQNLKQKMTADHNKAAAGQTVGAGTRFVSELKAKYLSVFFLRQKTIPAMELMFC